MVAPAIIGAAGSILSGLFGRSKPKYVVPDYQQIRDKAEAAGFNPLTALQMAPGAVVDGGGASMGTAIADAAQMLLGSVGAKAEGKLSQAQQENARLKKQVQSLTLRPKFGGVYAERESVPSYRAALGVPDGQGSRPVAPAVAVRPSGSGDVRGGAAGAVTAELPPLLESSSVDPRRQVDNLPITSDAGAIIIDNPNLGRAFPVPAVNGEVLELGQAAVVGGSFVYDRLKGRSVSDHAVDGMLAMDRAARAWVHDQLVTVPHRYNTALGRQRPAKRSDLAAVMEGPGPHVSDLIPAKPPRDAWPKFDLGKSKGWGRPRKWPFGPYVD